MLDCRIREKSQNRTGWLCAHMSTFILPWSEIIVLQGLNGGQSNPGRKWKNCASSPLFFYFGCAAGSELERLLKMIKWASYKKCATGKEIISKCLENGKNLKSSGFQLNYLKGGSAHRYTLCHCVSVRVQKRQRPLTVWRVSLHAKTSPQTETEHSTGEESSYLSLWLETVPQSIPSTPPPANPTSLQFMLLILYHLC